MQDELFSVEGQIVLVSGGSRGIGRGLARGFAERGAKVVIAARDQSTLEAAAAEMNGPRPVGTLVCDVSQPQSIEQCVEDVVAEHGRIDTLLNVAGVNIRKLAEEYSAEEYDFVLDINLRGSFLMATAVARQMLKQGSGSQINVDSLNSHSPLKHVIPYAMSKFGVVGMTRGLAAEWGNRGVRVNSIAPGFIRSDLTAKLWSDPGLQEWGKTNTPLERFLGDPEDLLGAAIFLASSASSWMTGQVVRVDGGMSAGTQWPIPS